MITTMPRLQSNDFLIYVQLQRQRCSRLERFYIREKNYSKNALRTYVVALQRWRCNS
jgi:hypothetical protein